MRRGESLLTSLLHNPLPLAVQRHRHELEPEMIIVLVKRIEDPTSLLAPARAPVN